MVLLGTYSMYQPVTVMATFLGTDGALDFKMPALGVTQNSENNFLAYPAFYLLYMNDLRDAKAFRDKVGLYADIVLTLLPIGNLTKLRHLKKVSNVWRLTKWSKTTVLYNLKIFGQATWEFSVGVIAFWMDYTDSCNSAFCNHLKRLIQIIEIAQRHDNSYYTQIHTRLKADHGVDLDEFHLYSETQLHLDWPGNSKDSFHSGTK